LPIADGTEHVNQLSTAALSAEEIEMRKSSPDREHWSQVAAEWIAWARTPDHDVFWAYREALADFLGRGDGEALDVGCGEGRVSRELKALGYRVTACDAVAEMVDAARQADSAPAYQVAAAADLPFETGRFPVVVSYNMLMDVEDVPAAVREMRRVMRPDGRLFISIVHPLADHGRFEGEGSERPFVMRGNYFGRQRFECSEQRDGLTMHFAGWSQPLEAYAAALEAAGLAITSLREPQPATDKGPRDVQKWTRMPLFLWLKARPLVA